LLISDVRHNIEFEEYPHTSNEGIAYVYNVSGWNGETAKKTFALINVQYSLGHPGNVKRTFFVITLPVMYIVNTDHVRA